jgi:uncharacterized RDD family membrane protein YckC
MNATGLFKREIFRPFVTLLIPGAVAIIPYILIVMHYQPWLLHLVTKNSGFTLTLLIFLAVAVGLIIEDLGACIESGVLDKFLQKKNSNHMADWDEYLKLTFEKEPIGQQYLDTIVLRMKFELGFCIALLVLWVGLLWFNIIRGFCSWDSFLIITGIIIIFCGYLLRESYDSARTLSKTRSLLINKKSNKSLE